MEYLEVEHFPSALTKKIVQSTEEMAFKNTSGSCYCPTSNVQLKKHPTEKIDQAAD